MSKDNECFGDYIEPSDADLALCPDTVRDHVHNLEVDLGNAVPKHELEAAQARIAELQTENQRLREALQQIENEAAFPQEDYDRHGPSYTTPSGTEFVFAVHFLAKCNELAEVARKALEDGQ